VRMVYLCVVLSVVLYLLQTATTSSSCPNYCKCLWRASKITVECVDLQLTSIPDQIDPATQVLNLSENNFGELTDKVFVLSGLGNLQRISLAAANISNIQKLTFAGLLNLVELDLSSNRLAVVPMDLFPFSLSLMNINLSNNPITALLQNQFTALRNLVKLDLSHCLIKNIHEEAFSGLYNLERLLLDSNQLVSLGGHLPDNLHGVTLHNNPWLCDCNLRSLKSWLDGSNVPRTLEPVCASPPRLNNFKVGRLSRDELACVPVVSPSSTQVVVLEGEEARLECRVQAQPPATIIWRFNGNRVQGRSPRISIKDQNEGALGYRSQLTISNVSGSENGSFSCSATNKAGAGVSNYTLSVVEGEVDTIMELRLDEFVVVSVVVIAVLLVLVVAVTLLLVHLCRHYQHSPNPAPPPTQMPKYIKMGTTNLAANCPAKLGALATPDILTGMTHCHITPDTSTMSIDTVTTPVSSDYTDMSVIMKDYGHVDNGQPIIGGRGRRAIDWRKGPDSSKGSESIPVYGGPVTRQITTGN